MTSCDAIPPGGTPCRVRPQAFYANSADKMSHRHLLLDSAFFIPQACHNIKAQSLSREAEAFYANCRAASFSMRRPNPDTSGQIRTADARHQWHAVHIFRVNSGIKTSLWS